MYVLVLLAVIMGQDGKPLPITRPQIEYYQSEADCKNYGPRHLKEFIDILPSDPVLLGAKCVKLDHVEGDPA